MAGPAEGPISAVPLFSGLKHLPCPKEAGGGRCNTVACLFGHREEASIKGLDGADDGSPAEERPAKRQRLDESKADDHGRSGGSLCDDGGLPKQSLPQGDTSHTDSQPAEFPTVEVSPATGQQRTGEGQHVEDNHDIGPQVTEEQEVIVNPSDEVAPSHLYDPLSPPTPYSLGKPKKPTTVGESPPLEHHIPESSNPISSSISQDSVAVSQKTPFPKRTETPVKALGPPKLTSSLGPASLVQNSTAAKATKIAQSPSVKTRKPEALNPRHLPKAPAAHSVRLQLLKLLHAQFDRLNGETSKKSSKEPEVKKLGLVMSGQELIWMALDREQHLAVNKTSIYSNLLKQDVVRYKKLPVDDWIKERINATATKQPEKKPANGSPVVINTGLTPVQEVEVLSKRLVTPIAGLAAYGYVPVPPTDEQIIEAKAAVEMSRNWEKCDRCTARFQVFPGRNLETGELASGGQCTHHPGRQYVPDRQKGDTSYVPKRYRCCGQDVGESPGCVKGSNHVWKTSDPKRLATLWNYAAAPANENPNVAKVVCFDCEMGYTVYGMELIRLTATSWPDGAELIDVLVQPFGEILDLNSQYSGVWPEDLARAVSWTKDWMKPEQKPGERRVLQKVSSPEVARDLLFSIISPDTILIGHGLENDLNAMRIVHPRLVDTILLYPHRRGLPIRTSLKILMETHLNRRIQMDTGEGHDSAEDARAAGDLARLKVQKEWSSMKSDGWKFVDGSLKEPGWKPTSPVDECVLQEDGIGGQSASSSEGGVRLTEGFLEAP